MGGYKIKQAEPVFADIACRQSAFKELFQGSDLGKQVLKDLLNECGVARTAFSKEGNEQTHYNLGKQLIGYHIMNLLNIQLQEIENG